MVSFSSMWMAVASTLVAVSSAADPELRIGGMIQDSYKPSFQLFGKWATTSKPGYTVKETFVTYDAKTMAAAVTKMTTEGDATYQDVLVCPYGSTAVIACVKAVNKKYTGPVLAWGGASEGIFNTDTCGALPNKNCFGLFTVAGKYTESGLVALDAKLTAAANVAIIANNNGFSASVAAGAKATVNAQAGLKLQKEGKLSVAKASLAEADVKLITDTMALKPDIVVIAGHNKDVEPVVIQIGKGSFHPKAILATNGISQYPTNYGANKKYAKSVMMPTQWDASTSVKDPVVGWTSADFKKASGGTATYQQASAGAAGVAIANAMVAAKKDKTKLVASLQAMDVDSFYGKLKWDAAGRIQKPMYTQQLQDNDAKAIVAPTGTGAMKCYGTNDMTCWTASASTSKGGTQVSGANFNAVSTSVILGMVLACLLK